jgi:Heparinase II/III N-terminus/Heparinase II/III-like protein
LQNQKTHNDVAFGAGSFYQDIEIGAGRDETLVKDIKLPWELSRFQHLVVLGTAYEQTKNITYANTFVRHLSDWLDTNPYLLGPNWKCPMDVGIRAINWIIGFCFFKDVVVDDAFWQTFVCSLYDHMVYLENNWEIYDSITSNHYLSDLIGYFYLCYFFSELPDVAKKTQWCYQEMLREFDKQIFDEGTDYEGSTRYHKLVTEIFYHFYGLAEHMGFCVPDIFKRKLGRMFSFLDWCTPHDGAPIQIGDNDSGLIVSGVAPELINIMKEKNKDQQEKIVYFPSFGLSLIKTKDWHISVRHNAYEQKQPTGHFHNDAGSITVNILGIDVVVDPGSYIYTPSKIWRNRFRSVNMHNTFFLEGIEPNPLDDRLFYLPLRQTQANIEQKMDDHQIMIQTSHDLYARFGLRAQRSIFFIEAENMLTLRDQWQKMDNKECNKNLISVWNFMLGPTIGLEKTDDGLILFHDNQPLVEMISSLNFEIFNGWYSSSYGLKVPCKQVKAAAYFGTEEYTILLKKLP